MADRTALGMIGLMLGAATVGVVTVGGMIVRDHLNGRQQFDDSLRRTVSLPATAR